MSTVAACVLAPAAMAQDAQDGDQADRQTGSAARGMLLEEVVVTAVPIQGTKFETSVSTSSLNIDQIESFGARSTAEIFRNIPGIRSESSGGDNNANIQVRGLPVTTGGSKFVGLQEDGLPVLQFGDITFGNPDNYLRADYTVANVQAIRGGSASTFASNAPGAVINLISRTGEDAGGSAAVTRGVDFDTTRVDFEYGGPIGDDWNFHIGGFYRAGEGPRDPGFTANDGGQVKANFTRKFENGYARVYIKHLNDRAIPYLPAPVLFTGSDADPDVGPVPGFDFSEETLSSPFFRTNPIVNNDGTRDATDVADGSRALSTGVGLELSFDFGDWTVENRGRFTANEGGFIGSFTAGVSNAADLAPAGGSLVFANGPNAGQAIADPAGLNGNGLVANVLVFDVDINDLSHFVNEFKVSRIVETSGVGSFTVSAGYYKSIQDVDTDWFFSTFNQEVSGDDPALIDVLDAGGVAQTVNGFSAFGTFNPSFDLKNDRDAVFASIAWEYDRLVVDGSVRYENVATTGTSSESIPNPDFDPTDPNSSPTLTARIAQPFDVNNDGIISPAEQAVQLVDNTALFNANFEVDYVSFSIGVNYLVTDDMAVFVRGSRGATTNSDRTVLGNAGVFAPDGSLLDEDTGVDFTSQIEFGVKYRSGPAIPGSLNLFLTGFYATSEESNFEVTSGLAFSRDIRAWGLELESTYSIGGFNLNAGLTVTNAEITADAINPQFVGNTPRRQADVTYQVTPSYYQATWGLTVGANVVGTTSSFAQDGNQLVLPGFAQVNLFANWEIPGVEGLSFNVNVNNVNDAFGVTEAEEGSLADGLAFAGGGTIIRARPINGRTTTVSLKYLF